MALVKLIAVNDNEQEGSIPEQALAEIGTNRITLRAETRDSNFGLRWSSPFVFLNHFDFTTNLYPPYNEEINGVIEYILITGVGRITDQGAYYNITNENFVNNITGSVLEIGDLFTPVELGSNLEDGGIKINSVDNESLEVYAIKFKHIYENGNTSNEGTIVFNLQRFTSLHESLSSPVLVNIPLESETVITLDMFDGLNPVKLRNNIPMDLYEVEDVFYQNNLVSIDPEALIAGNSFIPKLYILQSDFEPEGDFTQGPSERLTYAGVPVVYGQGIPISGINSGFLRYNSIGQGEDILLSLSVGYEGFLSGMIWSY